MTGSAGTAGKYNVSIFPCQETWDASGAAVCLFEEETSCIPTWQTGAEDFDFVVSGGRKELYVIITNPQTRTCYTIFTI